MIVKCKCQKCGYEWVPRVDNPKLCPECKCRKWNKENDHTMEGCGDAKKL